MGAIKTVILFDQYVIPVSMNKAAVDTDLQLHEYHAEDHRRLCRKTLCSGCGRELTADDIVKGYEYDDNCLVLLTKDELRQLKSDEDNSIAVIYSTALDQISPVYFSASYIAGPEAGKEKAFEILRLSLLDEQKILIGKAVLGGVDSYVAVIPSEDGLLISKLYLDSDLNRTRKAYKKPPVSQSDLEPFKNTVNEIYAAFDVSCFENDYQNNLRRFIEEKIDEGKDTYNIE